MTNFAIHKPEPGEYAPHFAKYVDRVPDGILEALNNQMQATLATLRGVSEAASLHRYAEGKWSLRELVGHISDTERIMAYRALRIARNDATPLPGFDQDTYITAANFDGRAWAHLLDEFESVRRSTLFLFEGLAPEAWTRRGVSNGSEITVRALAWVIAGHELHHLAIARERYLGA